MHSRQRGRGMRAIVVGASLTLALGSLGALKAVTQAQQGNPAPSSPLADGTYLYGEAPQPEQIGKGYVVFNHHQGKVTGAFYYPLSEFDCFRGSLRDQILDVKSTGAYDSEVTQQKINLLVLHRLEALSANDQRILSACQQPAASPSQ